jgi:hypothetical protein
VVEECAFRLVLDAHDGGEGAGVELVAGCDGVDIFVGHDVVGVGPETIAVGEDVGVRSEPGQAVIDFDEEGFVGVG